MASHILNVREIASDLEILADDDALDVQAMARMLVAHYPAKVCEVCEALFDHNMAIGNRPRAAAWDGIALEAVRLMACNRP